MADFLPYTPDTIIARAMFNYDAFNGTNFILSGQITVTVSDSFTKAQYDASKGNLSSDVYTNAASGAGGWTSTQLDDINAILQVYENFIPVNFSSVVDRSGSTPAVVGLSSDINISEISRTDLTFAGETALNTDLMFIYPGSRGDILLNTAKLEPSPTFATTWYSGHVLMHELGHVLGLSHPHLRFVNNNPILTTDFLATANVGFDKLGFVIESALDMNKEYFSVMSYDDQLPPGGNTFAQTPMILDVIALQTAYGEGRGSSGSGDDTITPGSQGQISSYRTYFDTGGNDTIDLVNYATGAYLHMGVTIDGAAHLVGVSMSTDDYETMISYGSPQSLRWFYGEFENAKGSAADDRIVGNELDNVITGGGGNDLLDGGDGLDTAAYAGPRKDYIVVMGSDGSMGVRDQVAGRDGTDTLTNFEDMRFADGVLVVDVPLASGLPVFLLLHAAFGHAPDELSFRNLVASDPTPLDLARQIVAMPAFVTAHASEPAKSFVDSLYTSAFNRAPDVAGETYWTSALAKGEAREQMLVDFAMSAEAQKLVAADVVTGFWLG